MNTVYRKIAFWMKVLGLEEYGVRVELANPLQATDEHGNAGVDLVGGIIDGGVANIFTTRRLRERDIVHELVHFRFPELNVDHNEIERMTDELIIWRNKIYSEASGGSRERF